MRFRNNLHQVHSLKVKKRESQIVYKSFSLWKQEYQRPKQKSQNQLLGATECDHIMLVELHLSITTIVVSLIIGRDEVYLIQHYFIKVHVLVTFYGLVSFPCFLHQLEITTMIKLKYS